MEPESADSPDAEEHAEEFSDVLEDLMDDVHERISSGEPPSPVTSDSDSLEFVDIIDENAIGTNFPEPLANQSTEDESEGGFWRSPAGIIIQILFYFVLFYWLES